MYSCILVCLYTCILVYLYTCILVYVYTCILVYLYTCILVYLYCKAITKSIKHLSRVCEKSVPKRSNMDQQSMTNQSLWVLRRHIKIESLFRHLLGWHSHPKWSKRDPTWAPNEVQNHSETWERVFEGHPKTHPLIKSKKHWTLSHFERLKPQSDRDGSIGAHVHSFLKKHEQVMNINQTRGTFDTFLASFSTQVYQKHILKLWWKTTYNFMDFHWFWIPPNNCTREGWRLGASGI